MSDDFKARIIKAINKFETKHVLVNDTPKRRNEKPEKEVERQVLILAKSKNWFVKVIEAKGTYSEQAKRYMQGQVKKGTADIIGVDENGFHLEIELKAAGRRSTLKEHQRLNLIEVINRNGFGCVTDNHYHLNNLYCEWLLLNPNQRRELLLNDLPKQSVKVNGNLFDDV